MQPSYDPADVVAARGSPATIAAQPLLECRGLVKNFAGVKAVRGVDFDIRADSVRGLVGENGAGKSTLIKLIAGVHQPDAGSIRLDGEAVRFSGADEALANRIVTVHQDINLVQTMTVAENILLNNEPASRFGIIRRKPMRRQVELLLAQYEIGVAPEAVVGDLPNDLKKMVQILKAICLKPRILLLDEPTSSLTDVEVKLVLKLIRRLAHEGVGVVLISHYLNEIFDVCDTLTVMRDGQVVADQPVAATNRAAVVTAMVGRQLDETRRGRPAVADAAGVPVLSVEGLAIKGRLHDISFALKPGEVLGITGLAGAGLGELAKALFGAAESRREAGVVRVAGQIVPNEPAAALAAGMALITGDRRREGILPDFNLIENICLPILPRFARGLGQLDQRAMEDTAARTMARLRVRAPGPQALAGQLSGGNQQKVVFAKWLETNPRIFIMDEPTIGIDVGSKAEIRAIIDEVAAAGVGVLLVTTELDELVSLCDRVLVMFRGALIAELVGPEIRREALLHAAACGEKMAA